MSGTQTAGDLAMHIVESGSLIFMDYEPRGIVGFESDIAKKMGCSSNQTENLLRAFDAIEDDQHFEITKERVSERDSGSHGKTIPAIIRVTITPA